MKCSILYSRIQENNPVKTQQCSPVCKNYFELTKYGYDITIKTKKALLITVYLFSNWIPIIMALVISNVSGVLFSYKCIILEMF